MDLVRNVIIGRGYMSKQKKLIREQLRNEVMKRSGYKCEICKVIPRAPAPLEAHHIINRNNLPNQGMTKWNIINLCSSCHQKAEAFLNSAIIDTKYSPNNLFRIIKSTPEKALKESEKLYN